jgi:hypothetical protein
MVAGGAMSACRSSCSPLGVMRYSLHLHHQLLQKAFHTGAVLKKGHQHVRMPPGGGRAHG